MTTVQDWGLGSSMPESCLGYLVLFYIFFLLHFTLLLYFQHLSIPRLTQSVGHPPARSSALSAGVEDSDHKS